MLQDNTTKWKVRKFTDFASNQALPLGYVHWSISPIVPAGELPLLGGTYDRSLYADLWSWANESGLVVSEAEWQANVLADGECDKFSDGNGSTTFRVPKLPTTIVTDASDGEIPVVGNGMAVGLTDGSTNYGLKADSEANIYGSTSAFGKPNNTNSDGGSLAKSNNIGITTDATKSGIVAKTSATKITGIWVIVAFGTVTNVGNADVSNVMQAVEQVQTGLGKVDGISDYIIESYRNRTEWYEVYKSGKVRQGGVFKTTVTGENTIAFHLPFSDNDYFVSNQPLEVNSTESVNYNRFAYSKTTTSFKIAEYANYYHIWVAEGQGA